jgi:hypothetical protein
VTFVLRRLRCLLFTTRDDFSDFALRVEMQRASDVDSDAVIRAKRFMCRPSDRSSPLSTGVGRP